MCSRRALGVFMIRSFQMGSGLKSKVPTDEYRPLQNRLSAL
jgi:hypothetical protein